MTDRLNEIKRHYQGEVLTTAKDTGPTRIVRQIIELGWEVVGANLILYEMDRIETDARWLIAEVEHLRRYADKLLAGWTWDFLPKDVEIISAANAQLATQVMELEAELEKLRGGIK